jgi:transposase InsO family protein
LAFRLRVVEAALEGNASLGQLSRVFGVSTTSIQNWLRRYEQGGIEGLTPVPPVPPPLRRSAAATAKREAVVAVRTEHREFGTRRIRDVLARFQALGVSETEVRRILHEEGLIPETPPASPSHPHLPRRFERAAPHQLWQSDIFTFLLRRHERLYLTAFMDDHSRYIVSWALGRHQRSVLVLEALARGIADYGTPQEILTDQGRQYTAWRGETEFEEELRRNGIRHVKSRPQHPQTLGKIERFWKTLWDEFLSRTVFADYDDCHRRIGLFVHAYNFQRPHQGIDGLVPADRFFQSAPQVREAVEKSVADNAARLAMEQPARKPFYLVGRLGDRDLTIAAQGGRLRVQLGDEQPQTIQLPKEEADVEEARSSQDGRTQPVTDTRDAEVARDEGARRDGETPVPLGALGALGRAGGDGRARGGADLARDVLQHGREGASGDARGARAVDDRDAARDRGEPGEADRGARSEGDAARAGEAAGRAAPALDAQGGALRADEGGGRAAAEAAPELDDRWAEAFSRLEGSDDTEPEREPFDPDAGWRGRALAWERKLAGADAPSDAAVPEDAHVEEEDVRAGAGDPGGDRGEVPGDARGDLGGTQRGVGGEAPASLAQPLPDAVAQGAQGLRPGATGEAGGSAGEAGARGGALGRAGEAAQGEREAARPGGSDRPAPGGGERPLARTGEDVEPSEDAETAGDEDGGAR